MIIRTQIRVLLIVTSLSKSPRWLYHDHSYRSILCLQQSEPVVQTQTRDPRHRKFSSYIFSIFTKLCYWKINTSRFSIEDRSIDESSYPSQSFKPKFEIEGIENFQVTYFQYSRNYAIEKSIHRGSRSRIDQSTNRSRQLSTIPRVCVTLAMLLIIQTSPTVTTPVDIIALARLSRGSPSFIYKTTSLLFAVISLHELSASFWFPVYLAVR